MTLAPALALVTVLLLIPLPVEQIVRRWPALLGEIENAAHPLVFAWLAWLGFRVLRRRMPAPDRRPYLLAFAITVLFGLITEIVQALVGRDSAWIDLRNDALGALFALALIARNENFAVRQRAAHWLFTSIATACVLLALAPLAWTATAYLYRYSQSPVLWQEHSALLQRFSVWQTGRYEGLEIKELAGDWRGYSHLEVEGVATGDDPVEVNIRVHDRAHTHQFKDRYNEKFTLPTGTATTLEIPLDRIRRGPATRMMDLAAIRVIVVFQDMTNQTSHFRVTEVRLVR